MIELMITVALAVIIISIAAPSFMHVIRNSRLTNQTNDIVAALNVARSRALTESAHVVVCPSSDLASCDASRSWGDGWIMFVDCNEDGDLDSGGTDCINSTPERMLRQGESPSGASLNVAANAALQFEADGRVAASRTFTACVSGLDTARQIVVNSVGRARVIEVAAADECG